MTFPPRTVGLWKSRSVFPWYVYVVKAPQVILMYNLIEEPAVLDMYPNSVPRRRTAHEWHVSSGRAPVYSGQVVLMTVGASPG